jgi:hypothetical protein
LQQNCWGTRSSIRKVSIFTHPTRLSRRQWRELMMIYDLFIKHSTMVFFYTAILHFSYFIIIEHAEVDIGEKKKVCQVDQEGSNQFLYG